MLKSFSRPFLQHRVHLHKSFTLMSQQQQKRAFSAACCIIGDEILNGKTRDSNAYYLGITIYEFTKAM